MPSEKELFVTKQYVPVGPPMVQNDHTIIYKVKCLAEPGKPEALLKMYRHKNIQALYTHLYQLDYSEWPHIYNVKFFDGSTLVVEEYLKGCTLAELLERNRAREITFSEDEAHRIMERLCDCINQLMEAQPPIVHHNLKASNIFVTNAGAVKLLDFVPGESNKGKNPYHNIFQTLGKLLHRMLTGKSPKNGKCSYEGKYEDIIRKCIQKDPAEQYQNMKDLREDLDYAKTLPSTSKQRGIAFIPYALTIPFQGTILGFEWLLFTYFRQTDSTSTMTFFGIIFLAHAAAFALRRFTFLKKNHIRLGVARTVMPILILVAILLCLTWLASSFVF